MLKPNAACLKHKQVTIILEKNITIDKKYILRKFSLKSRNSKSNMLSKIVFYMFSVIYWNSLELRGK